MELYRAGVEVAQAGDIEGAMELYRRALQMDPELVEAHISLGRSLIPSSFVEATGTRDLDVLDEAIGHLERAAALEPENADYAYLTGRALDKRGREDEALVRLQRAVELDPEHGKAHKRIGLIHAERGDFELAAGSFLAAMELLPDDATVHLHYGNLLLETDPETAREAYERAIEITPTLPLPYQKLAQLLARLGDAEGAAAAEERFATWKAFDDRVRAAAQHAWNNPMKREAQVASGELYFAASRWDAALPMFRRALILDAADPLTHLYCGKIMIELEEYEVARNHLEESAFLAPGEVVPVLELIRLYTLVEDEERVSDLLEQLDADLGPEDVDDRLQLAELLLELDRTEDSARQYAAILARDPDNGAAKAGLARAGGGEKE